MRIGLAVLLAVLVASCRGVPIRSMPRLVTLERELTKADPAEFMIAVQVDEKLAIKPGSVPEFLVKMTPRVPGAFEPVDKKLPMQLMEWNPTLKDLRPAGNGRRWLIYGFPPESAAEMTAIRERMLRLKEQGGGEKAGGTLSVGISQQGLAVDDPAMAGTRWETWLQTSKKSGFFEIWSGPLDRLFGGRRDR